MTNWQSDYIQSNDLRIHYTRTGGDKPPLVLAHGFSDDGLCWTPIAQELAADYDIIMVDARGHGRSEAPEQGYSPLEMAADLAGVITGLGLTKPAILGHSMGGATTYVLAGTYPDLPGAILIEDSGPLNLASGNRPDAQDRQDQARQRLSALQSLDRTALIETARRDNPTWPEAELGPWAEAKQRFNLRAVNRMGTSVDDWEARLARIRCPVLLLTADPDRGALVAAEDAARLQGLIPQLEVVHVPGAGHNIRREQPERYLAAVRPFLARTLG